MCTYQMTHITDKIQFALYCHDFSLFINRANSIRQAEKAADLNFMY